MRVAVAPDLQPVLTALLRCMVAIGCTIRFGPPPRGTNERAVLRALKDMYSAWLLSHPNLACMYFA